MNDCYELGDDYSIVRLREHTLLQFNNVNFPMHVVLFSAQFQLAYNIFHPFIILSSATQCVKTRNSLSSLLWCLALSALLCCFCLIVILNFFRRLLFLSFLENFQNQIDYIENIFEILFPRINFNFPNQLEKIPRIDSNFLNQLEKLTWINSYWFFISTLLTLNMYIDTLHQKKEAEQCFDVVLIQ